MQSVPTIDLQAAETNQFDFTEMDRACRQHGFFLLENHGMDSQINAMWQSSKQFFALNVTEKRKLLRSQQRPLGYYDRELTKRQRDLKEVFDFMMPRDDQDAMNQWPAGIASFREVMLDFFHASSQVASRTLNIIFRALAGSELDATQLPQGSARTSSVRLNCYPLGDPLDKAEQVEVTALGDMALHHHTDPGILTLLLQDMTGGLQAHSRTQGWIDIPPQPGTVVINLGDAMQVWTNDQYRSAVHRVLPRTEQTRYSTPYFYSPEQDAILAPIPELIEHGDQPAYQAFTWKEYIQGRIDDNYTDLGQDDIQIARFRKP